MNERIRELEAQCWEHDQSWTGVGQRVFNREKFALLIVADCINTIKLSAGSHLMQNATECDVVKIQLKVEGALTAMASVAEHFGVE